MTNRTVRNWLGFGVSQNVYKFAFMALFLSACNGGCNGCGCGGFENTPYPPSLYNETVQKSGQVRITPTGLAFLSDNVPTLVEAALPGGLTFCVPEQSGTVSFCYGQTCSDGVTTGCDMTLTIDDAEIRPSPPQTLDVDITVGDLNEELPVKILGANCLVKLKSKAGNPNGAQVMATVPIDFTVSATSPTGDVQIGIGDLVTDLSDLDIDIAPKNPGNIGQIFACGATNIVLAFNIVNDIIIGVITPTLTDAISNIEREQLCVACDMGACPTSATCASDDICEYTNGECVPMPLGVEGRMLIGEVMSGFTERPEAGLDTLIKVADYAKVDDGLTLGARSGYQPDTFARCAPIDPRKRPDFQPIPISQTITGNLKPNGQPFMFGMGYHRKALQHAMWSVWASGATCMLINQDSLGSSFSLTAGTISALVPSLKKIATGDGALVIKIIPQVAPDVILGANTVTPDGDSYTVNDPLMTIDWKDLDIHMYFFAQDRWTRVFTLRGDIVVPIAIVPDGMGQIVPVLGDLSDLFQNVRVQEAGLVAEADQQKLIDLMPTLVGAAIPSLVGTISDPIALPEFFGLEFDFQEGDITSVDNNEMIALYANLKASQQTLVAGIHMGVASHQVRYGSFGSGMMKPSVELKMFGAVPSILDAEIEYAYKVDDGWWSLYRASSTLQIEDPLLVIPGEHQILVKARLRGEPRTATQPVATSVLIDWDGPDVVSARFQEGRINVVARDLVDDEADLSYRFRLVGVGLDGEWSDWGSASFVPEATLPELLRADIEVRDRSGNIGTHTEMLRTAVALTEAATRENQTNPGNVTTTQGSEPKAGCNASGAQPTGWLALLFLAALFVLRRRRRISPAWLLAGFVAMSGCSCDDDVAANECDSCPSGTYCNEAKECVLGCDEDIDCGSGKKCEENQCVQDCDQICAGSCTDTEFGMCNEAGECTCVPYCEAGCGEGEYCCYKSDSCDTLPDPCSDQVCEPGFEPAVQTPSSGENATCEVDGGSCECVELPPLPMGLMGQYVDIYQNGGVTAAAFYNATYGDLMVATFDASLAPTYHWVDGIPDTGVVGGSLNGPRGGIRTSGDKMGTHTAIVVDDSGTLHVFYRDEEAKNLKYARGTGSPDYTWEFATLDNAPDTGYWTDAELIGDTIHLVYTADNQGSPGAFEALIRYATFDVNTAVGAIALTPTTLHSSASSNPCGQKCDRREKCFPSTGMCETVADTCGECPTGSECRSTGTCEPIYKKPALNYQPTTGLHNQLSRTPDGLLLTFYDHTQETVGWTQFSADAWSMPQFVGTPSGPYGSGFVDANGNLHLAYMDLTEPSLVYQDVANGVTETVVEGARDRPGQWYIAPIGEDVTVRVDTNGDVVLSYHDASLHTLNVATRTGGMWSTSVIGEPGAPYSGAHGFYSSLYQVPDSTLLIEYVINQQTDPSSGTPTPQQ